MTMKQFKGNFIGRQAVAPTTVRQGEHKINSTYPKRVREITLFQKTPSNVSNSLLSTLSNTILMRGLRSSHFSLNSLCKTKIIESFVFASTIRPQRQRRERLRYAFINPKLAKMFQNFCSLDVISTSKATVTLTETHHIPLPIQRSFKWTSNIGINQFQFRRLSCRNLRTRRFMI